MWESRAACDAVLKGPGFNRAEELAFVSGTTSVVLQLE
jgi:hypothetical protein